MSDSDFDDDGENEFQKQLDAIGEQRDTLADALDKATDDGARQTIRDQLSALEDVRLQLISDAFDSEAAAIAALSDNLNAMLAKLRGHIDSFYFDELIDIGKKYGLLPANGAGGGAGGGQTTSGG